MPIDLPDDAENQPGGSTSGGFLSRWSERKKQARKGQLPDDPVKTSSEAVVVPAAAPASDAGLSEPTLLEAEQLTMDSDFSRFVSANAKPDVKNMALKKLFADKHFNQMDGLDIYIDDYGIADPLPDGWLEKMEHVKGWLIPREPEMPTQDASAVQIDSTNEPAQQLEADCAATPAENNDVQVQDNMSRPSQSD